MTRLLRLLPLVLVVAAFPGCGPAGEDGATGAAATKLFVLYDAIDGAVKQQSGGITVSGQQFNSPFQGFSKYVATLPQDVTACVAMATPSAQNGGFIGVSDAGPLFTSISGTTVTIYGKTPLSGILPGFALAVFC